MNPRSTEVLGHPPACRRPAPQRPWLSVIIPTYNGDSLLPQALESVLAQGDPNLELIAIDDGSTDGTLDVLESFRSRLPVQVLTVPHTGNWAANTNLAMQRAQGRWMCFLHQDDVWFGGRLERLRPLLSQYPDAELFLHPSRYVDTSGKPLGLWSCPLPGGPIEPARMVERLLVQNFISMPAPMLKSETARRVGGLDESLWYTADWDFWLKLASQGPTVYLPQPLSGFRLHPASQTVERSKDLTEFERQLTLVLERHLARCQGRVAGSVKKAARFSVLVNTRLAGSLQGQRPGYLGLALRFLALGPAGWRRYLRDSRVLERTRARLRAGIGGASAASPKRAQESAAALHGR
jgi:GT2 family glycosyltransferase